MSNHLGRWDIAEMEMWPIEYINLNEPGYFLIEADGTGNFLFGAVECSIDGYMDKQTGRFEYSFEGMNDSDQISGRGWLIFSSSEKAKGRIFIHMGDQSSISLKR